MDSTESAFSFTGSTAKACAGEQLSSSPAASYATAEQRSDSSQVSGGALVIVEEVATTTPPSSTPQAQIACFGGGQEEQDNEISTDVDLNSIGPKSPGTIIHVATASTDLASIRPSVLLRHQDPEYRSSREGEQGGTNAGEGTEGQERHRLNCSDGPRPSKGDSKVAGSVGSKSIAISSSGSQNQAESSVGFKSIALNSSGSQSQGGGVSTVVSIAPTVDDVPSHASRQGRSAIDSLCCPSPHELAGGARIQRTGEEEETPLVVGGCYTADATPTPTPSRAPIF